MVKTCLYQNDVFLKSCQEHQKRSLPWTGWKFICLNKFKPKMCFFIGEMKFSQGHPLNMRFPLNYDFWKKHHPFHSISTSHWDNLSTSIQPLSSLKELKNKNNIFSQYFFDWRWSFLWFWRSTKCAIIWDLEMGL